MKTNRQLALLIDGDNAQAALLPQMLSEVSKYGTATIRRVYGDWSQPNMSCWHEVVHTYALVTVQQPRNTPGKNATDFALVIDAMDILHMSGMDGFCIVSSDSDYTRLALRLRESNLFVMGIGRSGPSPSFVNACEVFVKTETLQAGTDTSSAMTKTAVSEKPAHEIVPVQQAKPASFPKLLKKAIALSGQDNQWILLSQAGDFLRKVEPDFDPKVYGHKQMSQLVQAHPDLIEIKQAKTGSSGVFSIRLKK
ncbi:MAG: NYN domain-containing protein [Chloroflexota bacterium]|nr:NYN domain-containing protein [Chloroflexota bacterium]